MILEIHPNDPQPRLIEKVIDILKNDGVIIYGTDSTYAFGCNIQSKRAMNRIYQIKDIDKKKPLTFICSNTQQFQQYTKGISTPVFRKIKSIVPGPYTFIFEASKMVPKIMLSPRATIGVKMPEAPIATALAEGMQQPVLSSSLPGDESGIQNPYDIEEEYGKRVDCILDCGDVYISRSAIIDFSVTPAEIIRPGDADLSWIDS
ncbi:MAG: threonylcarbamoyl-AMP synthase [Deltaproteobacteria bacterium]|jgi:tRNA threonylcarbamoyl adenosine modification protein (Sua5/YciO/YrdC/YwlC family)|nr:threonylcarbamoyl-AMP synthase [Deltaproteobacteria bacterium]MBT7152780.1 threonylcarbamoyl-AMP synthase [Deltaproteobacteria bacterium]